MPNTARSAARTRNTRKEEMLQFKIANAIKTLRRAIVEGLRFDHLLVDSWFPCAELL